MKTKNQNESKILNRISFFHIVNWLISNLKGVPKGKDIHELTTVLNETEELSEFMPKGGLTINSTPKIAELGGYDISKTKKKTKTVIARSEIQRLERKLSLFETTLHELTNKVQGLLMANDSNMEFLDEDYDDEITLPDNYKEYTIPPRRDRKEVLKAEEKLTPLEDLLQDEPLISPEDEPVSSDGDPAVRTHEEVDKAQSFEEWVDKQDDTVEFPEDQPEVQLDEMKDDGLAEGSFEGFEPSDDIKAILKNQNI